jgi:NAD+ diphosphatase
MLNQDPTGFASTADLPFNRAILGQQLELAAPDQDPGGEGSWLLLRGDELLTIARDGQLQLPVGESPLLTSSRPPLYIGQWQGRPCRLLEVQKKADLPDQLQPQSLRAAESQAALPLLSLGGVGRMILHWEASSRYCGYCGAAMLHLPGEWGKACSACQGHHFPRIHPCVIGLVVRDREILLARKPEWAPGRYSLVAGFVEFGECLEEAMAREVEEETGIQIANVRYLGSQSWPFPSQLMCGFVADYAGGEIELRDQELAEAYWCPLERLPNLPPKRSIARHIIDRAAEFI